MCVQIMAFLKQRHVQLEMMDRIELEIWGQNPPLLIIILLTITQAIMPEQRVQCPATCNYAAYVAGVLFLLSLHRT